MTESARNFFFRLLPKLISPPNSGYNYTIKVFATYYPHYKEKCEMTKFLYKSNLFHRSGRLAVSFFAYNGNACNAELGLVTKKR